MKSINKILGNRIYLEALNQESLSKDYLDWMKDEEVLQYLTGRTKAYSLNELEDYVAKTNDSFTDYLFGIFLVVGNVHIGNIKIGDINSFKKVANVGLLIGNKNLWGKGYATEAIGLVTQFAFDKLNLNRLTAGMVVDNIGSYRAFLKVGYKEIRISAGQELLNGRYVDIKQVEKCIASVS